MERKKRANKGAGEIHAKSRKRKMVKKPQRKSSSVVGDKVALVGAKPVPKIRTAEPPTDNRVATPRRTAEERREIMLAVILDYKQSGDSMTRCWERNGLAKTQFYEYLDEDETGEYIALYRAAANINRVRRVDDMKEELPNSLKKVMQGYEDTETVQEFGYMNVPSGRLLPDGTPEVISTRVPKKVTVTKKQVPPNARILEIMSKSWLGMTDRVDVNQTTTEKYVFKIGDVEVSFD